MQIKIRFFSQRRKQNPKSEIRTYPNEQTEQTQKEKIKESPNIIAAGKDYTFI